MEARPRGAIRVGHVVDAEIRVSASCLLVVGLLAVAVAPRVDRVAPGLGGAAYAVGVLVGLLVYAAALLHEVAHAVVARRHGRAVVSITLGAAGGRTVVDGEAHRPREELLTAAAGPAVSLALGLAALAARATVDGGPAAVALEAVVLANLVIGAIDLVPAPPLDGGRMVKAAAWRVSGSALRGGIVAAWVGRATAVVVLIAPMAREPVLGTRPGVVDLVVCGALALLLWGASSRELVAARLRLRLGNLDLGALVLPVLTVEPDLPVAEALRRAEEAGAGAVVTVEPGGTLRLATSTAVDGVPPERRPWVPTSSVTSLVGGEGGLLLPADVDGDGLLAAVRRRAAPEYLVADAGGTVRGVLRLRDVDRLVRRR